MEFFYLGMMKSYAIEFIQLGFSADCYHFFEFISFVVVFGIGPENYLCFNIAAVTEQELQHFLVFSVSAFLLVDNFDNNCDFCRTNEGFCFGVFVYPCFGSEFDRNTFQTDYAGSVDVIARKEFHQIFGRKNSFRGKSFRFDRSDTFDILKVINYVTFFLCHALHGIIHKN